LLLELPAQLLQLALDALELIGELEQHIGVGGAPVLPALARHRRRFLRRRAGGEDRGEQHCLQYPQGWHQ